MIDYFRVLWFFVVGLFNLAMIIDLIIEAIRNHGELIYVRNWIECWILFIELVFLTEYCWI